MTIAAASQLRQRADYTHKPNLQTGRHGWLRLTPAYSVKVVEEVIGQCKHPMKVLDPFCGTGTTVLSAAYHGHQGVTTDINPFLVWLSRAKTAHYTPETIRAAQDACSHALSLVQSGRIVPTAAPPIHNIERWWSPEALRFLCSLQAGLAASTNLQSAEHALLTVAFCRTLISLSNATFNHQSMSFKNETPLLLPFGLDMASIYKADVRFVLQGAAQNPQGESKVILADARELSAVPETFDRLVTSPPYANRMSYIRELRPYMYWLGYLASGREAGELDWSAIGGTWGIATSRLTDWSRSGQHFQCAHLELALDQIAHHDNKNGPLLSSYVAKYFDDMWLHFQGVGKRLAQDAVAHYIVGNSTFYGVLLSVEQIYAEMLLAVGFRNVACQPIRKRNSKKELVEFNVTGIWPG